MADVPGKFFKATKVRTGVSPSSPGVIEGETLPPLNPPGGSLNSVGLSMPSAFNVANSPLTSNGTLAVTGAGTVGQYIRGDGSLADFPQASGGGSSVSYYLNGSVNQGTIGGVAYRELSKVPILGAGTDFTINADGYIASFITDAGDPNLLEIPGGNWNFETYFSASSGGGSPTFYVELYKVSGTTATLIASSSSAPELIAFGTNLTPYYSTLAVPTTTLALTDRLAIRYYVTHSGRTITLHTENNHLCQIITTFTTGLTALNGLTAQVQNFAVGTTGTDFNIASVVATHTFNLPTASATNRGALSSADWSLFRQAYNDKINSASVTGTTTKTLTLVQQDGGEIQASWSDLNTDAVTSVFGRTGAVVAVSGDYNTSQVTESGNLYFTNARAIASTLTGYVSGAGTISSADSILTAIQKLNGNIGALVTGVSSVNGQTGAVTLTTTNIGEGTNLYFTNTRARAALSFAAGSGAYNTTTGVITIPTDNNQIANGANYITAAALSAYLPLAGGTMTGVITTPNGTFGIVIGDDSRLADRNIANTLFLEGNQNTDRGYINFSQTSGNALGAVNGGDLTWRGNVVLHAANFNSYAPTLGGTGATGTWSIAITGNAGTANTWTTARTITIGNTGKSVNGSANVAWSLAEIGAYAATNPSAFIALTALSGVAPIQYNNTTGAISITQASGSTNGFLSSTDWTTFNNKQNALTNPVTGTGASGQVAFWNGTTTQTGDNGLFWDNTNKRLGIGTPSPSTQLQVVGSSFSIIRISGASDNVVGVDFGTVASPDIARIRYSNSTNSFTIRANGSDYLFLNSSGNLGLGVTPPSWSIFRAINVLNGSFSTNSNVGGGVVVARNWYFDGAERYYENGTAQRLELVSNGFFFQTATTNSSGAGAALTWGSPMTLNNSGRLLLGTTDDNGARLQVSGAATFGGSAFTGRIISATANNADYGVTINQQNASGGGLQIFSDASSWGARPLNISSGSATQFTINSSGNVGIGTPSPQSPIDVISPTNGYVSFGRNISVGQWTGIHFGYREDNTFYRKSAIVFERTGGAAQGNIHFLNNNANDITSASLSDSRMTITSGGNLGLGVTPSEWSSSWRAFEFQAAAIAWTGAGANDFSFSTNSFFDAADSRWEYKSTGDGAARYSMTALTSQHRWFVAPIGTANQPITFTQAMTLDASGRLGIGTPTPSGQLHLRGASGLPNFGDQMLQIESTTSNFSGIVFSGTNGSNAAIRSEGASTMTFWTASGTSYTERMRIFSGGNIHIGPTPGSDNGARLQVSGTATFSSTINASDLITSNSGFRTNSLNGYVLRNDGNNLNLGGLTRRGFWAGGTAADTQIFAETGYSIFINPGGLSSVGLTLAPSGAATFSSSVTAANGYLGGGASFTNIGQALNTPSNISANIGVLANTYAFIDLSTQHPDGGWIDFSKGDGSDYGGRIRYFNSIDQFRFYTNASGTAALSLASTGAATFSSSVTAGGTFTSSMGNNALIFNSSSATTGFQYITLINSGASMTLGIERSTGGALSNGSTAYASLLQTSNSTDLQFGTANNVRMTITSGGNVLIGTTTDGGRLRVKASGNDTYAIAFERSNATTTIGGFYQNSGSSGELFLRASNGSDNVKISSTADSYWAAPGARFSIGTSINSSDLLRVAGNTFSNTIMTWNPENDNRSGVEWRLGAASIGSITPNRRLRVNVGGVEYFIGAVEV